MKKQLLFLLFLALLPVSFIQADTTPEMEEHLINGGFELGTMEYWLKENGLDVWWNNQPHGATPAGEVPYEGDWRVYMNPNDHADPAASQIVALSTSEFMLSWGILPHSGSYPRLVTITALDETYNTLTDGAGRRVELVYSMVGDYSGSLGYKIFYDIPTRNPNTGIDAWDYFERDFQQDYVLAGGNSEDFEQAHFIKLSFQARDGSGGTSWDAFSIKTETSLDAEQIINQIKNLVESSNIHHGIKNGLSVKIEQITNLILDGEYVQASIRINSLRNHVNAQLDKKINLSLGLETIELLSQLQSIL